MARNRAERRVPYAREVEAELRGESRLFDTLIDTFLDTTLMPACFLIEDLDICILERVS